MPYRPVRQAYARLMVVVLAVACSKGNTPGDAGQPPVVSDGFTNVFAGTGIDSGPLRWQFATGPMLAAAVGDCDADGLPDAFAFSWGGSGKLWRNKGDFQFEAVASGIAGSLSVPSSIKAPLGAAFGDLDNDGRPDLLVAHQLVTPMEGDFMRVEVRVYRNDGGCRFTDVSEAWGFGLQEKEKSAFITGFDLADANLDGRLDVMVRRVLNADAPVSLFLSQPDGTWAERAPQLFGDTKGACWSNLFADVDNDGLLDLFMFCDHYLGSTGHYFHNVSTPEGPKFVEEIFDPRLFGPDVTTGALMGGSAGDVDGDGLLDIFMADIGAQHLYTHRAGLKDAAEAAGVAMPRLPDGSDSVGWSASFADYDNDTWPDLTVARGTTEGWIIPQRMILLRNRGDGTFEDTTPLLNEPGPHDQTWMTASDLDRDGKVDYWFGGQHDTPVILKNETKAGGSFALRLRGRTSNADGVGARVSVKVGSRTMVQEMYGGSGPYGYGEHRLMFGLGTAATADSIEIRWPSGFVQVAGPATNGTEVVIEEPDLVQVQPAVLSQGQSVKVTVRPAKPDGSLLGAGHAVTVTMEPGHVSLVMRDDGAGTYSGSTIPPAAGTYGFSVTIDGSALRARPQVLVR